MINLENQQNRDYRDSALPLRSNNPVNNHMRNVAVGGRFVIASAVIVSAVEI